LPDHDGAGLHRATVDMDGAGAALAGVTADMRTGQSEMVAQQMDEKGAIFDIGGHRLAVYRQLDCGHA
jgi:hypothetical protein